MNHIYEAVPVSDNENENTRRHLPPHSRCGRIITKKRFCWVCIIILMLGLFMTNQNTTQGNFIHFHVILCSRNEIFTS